VMLYGKVARGFHSGGPQSRIAPGATSELNYDPEFVTEFEGGVKSELFDRRVRLNGAFFYDKLTDAQFIVTVLSGGGFGTAVQNAGRKDVYGFEGEVEVAPLDRLRLGGTVGWTKVNFKEVLVYNSATDSLIDVAGAFHPDGVPKWAYSLYGSYTQPTNWGDVALSLNWAWRGDAFTNSQQVKGPGTFPPELEGIPGFAPGALTDEEQTTPAYGVLGGQLKLHIDSADIDVAFWGKNLFNEKVVISIPDLIRSGLGMAPGQVLQTRSFGIDVTKKF